MKIIEDYNNALQAIYDHVGFKEDWVVCPIDDCLEMFWNTDGDTVFFAESKKDFNEQDGKYYEDEVYKQRFYSKWVYEGEDFTLIFCDPNVDGMKYFRIFDNKKKLPISSE